MAKGGRGGRRSGKPTGGVNPNDIKGTTNLLIDTDLDEITRGEVTRTLKDFQDKYGLEYNNTRIANMKPGTGVLAYYDGDGIAKIIYPVAIAWNFAYDLYFVDEGNGVNAGFIDGVAKQAVAILHCLILD